MIKRKKPIRRVSKKRAAELKQYSALRKQFLEERPVCEVWCAENGWARIGKDRFGVVLYAHRDQPLFWQSDGLLFHLGADRSSEVHHIARRGKNYLNTDTWLAVSSRNHKRIEGQSTYDGKPYGMSWARASGFLL